ncbi:MAG: CPBP family intramembrane glutamic endopeptidase [Synechococcaceae cyanobacterium]|nr:CPBP family intramembrane glutamic endopeptidase [Synechococcaceae cyanobacterium]
MTGSDRSTPATSPRPAGTGWKPLLALFCLSLTALIWLVELAGSLERPSVLDSLELREMELVALAADGVPAALRPALVGEDPRGRLAEDLQERMEEAETPPTALSRLELTLLRPADPGRTQDLRELAEMVDAPRRPLIEALLQGRRVEPGRQADLLAPWEPPAMVAQLSCEQLGGPAQACPASRSRSGLLLRLLGVTVIPALLVLVGMALLVRQFWLVGRRRLEPAAPLHGPPLSLTDVILLIAGGFVIWEVLVSLVALPLAQSALVALAVPQSLGQGLQVLVLYLGLMSAPLLLLWLMLRHRPHRPVGGWLQWYWRPPASALGQAAATVLMVMPAVALTGWLIDRLWDDPGGSNPLLEQVLTSNDGRAVACLALTAVVLAPLFEETLFRGVLLPVLGERVGAGGAIVGSAGVFALAHLSLSELAPLFVLGLGLGWLRWRTGRLACCSLMHALWNGFTFVNLLLLAG